MGGLKCKSFCGNITERSSNITERGGLERPLPLRSSIPESIMPFIAVPGAAQVHMRYDWWGQRVENVLGVMELADGAFGDGEAVIDVFLDWFNTSLKAQLSTNIILKEIFFQEQETEGAPGALRTLLTPIGGSSGPSVPNNVAFVITLRTGISGRSYRGRSYVPGLPKDAVTGSLLSAGVAADLVSSYNALNSNLHEMDVALAILSRFHLNAPRSPGIANQVTAATYVDLSVDSQRRRLPGRGT